MLVQTDLRISIAGIFGGISHPNLPFFSIDWLLTGFAIPVPGTRALQLWFFLKALTSRLLLHQYVVLSLRTIPLQRYAK